MTLMKKFFLVATVLLGFAFSGCTTMEDCCECLVQKGGIECVDTHQSCVNACFQLCESTRACYCSDARRVDCSAECGCEY